MKKVKQFLVVFTILAIVISITPTQVSLANSPVHRTIRSAPNGLNDWQFRENVNGWDVEVWTQHQDWSGEANAWVDIPNLGQAQMLLYEDGSFSCEWERSFNSLFRTGRGFARGNRVSEVGEVSINYNVSEFSSTNTSYLCVYGWTWHNDVDTMVEYYIVDDWHPNWRPGGPVGSAREGYTYHGIQVIDGQTYDIYTNWRINQPSIAGNRTFMQIFSVNQTPRRPNRGVISVSEHFRTWETRIGTVSTNDAGTVHNGRFHAGLELYEVSFTIEGFGGRNLSNGVGRVDTLCLTYGTNSICTQSGCHHCDGTVPAPVCGVNNYECGQSSCVICNRPCVCPARPSVVLYEAPLTSETAAALSADNATGGLQPAGLPLFTHVPGGGITVSGRTDNWNAVDVQLAPLNLVPTGEYKITVTGHATVPFQVQFPLDGVDNIWDTGTTTGTVTGVSMNFTGEIPTIGGGPGAGGFRLRVRTDSVDDFTVTGIKIEGIAPCCGTCHVACSCHGTPPPPVCGVNEFRCGTCATCVPPPPVCGVNEFRCGTCATCIPPPPVCGVNEFRCGTCAICIPPPPTCNDCRSCVYCGFHGGRFGFGRVTDSSTSIQPTIQDALAILRHLVNLYSPLNEMSTVRAEAFAAANITRAGQEGVTEPILQDALAILRFIVGLPSPELDAIYR